ncbi:hypothetical protein [Streptomyces rochei]|uniref:hypothetical protein n=1 Tax=Streptomyces rochei TaxID=1928 RepID=UPI0036B8D616
MTDGEAARGSVTNGRREGILFLLIAGLTLIGFGVSLIVNVREIAYRIFDFYAPFMNAGRATRETFRYVGIGGVLVGVLWVAASFSIM